AFVKAAGGGHGKIVKYLNKQSVNSAEPIVSLETKGTAIRVAAANGQYRMVKSLHKKYGANIRAVDDNGNRPLHLAAENGHCTVVKYIVGKPGDQRASLQLQEKNRVIVSRPLHPSPYLPVNMSVFLTSRGVLEIKRAGFLTMQQDSFTMQ
ncbi:hypothetical protein CYMTET_18111, partial [Cymbomonas tetramitiformis]